MSINDQYKPVRHSIHHHHYYCCFRFVMMGGEVPHFLFNTGGGGGGQKWFLLLKWRLCVFFSFSGSFLKGTICWSGFWRSGRVVLGWMVDGEIGKVRSLVPDTPLLAFFQLAFFQSFFQLWCTWCEAFGCVPRSSFKTNVNKKNK